MRALPLRLLAALCVVAGLFPLANVVGTPATVPWWDAAVREWIVRGSLVLLAAVFVAFVGGQRLDDMLSRAERALLGVAPGTFAAASAAFAFLAAAVLAQYCFNGQPFTSDEMAQQWHARILLSGHLSAVPEQWREFFNTAPVFDQDGRWFSQYPVGGPALIAIGLAAGGAWLVNPVLLAVATRQLYQFLRRTSDELPARLAVLLFITSPMVLVMGASQMNHVPTLALALTALANLAAWDSSTDPAATRRHAMTIGLCLGAMSLIRPLDAALVTVLVVGTQAMAMRASPGKRGSFVVEVVSGAVPLLILLWVNAQTTGRPLLFGYEALNGPEHAIGFHTDPTGELHTPLRGLRLASGYLMRLDRFLFEWPIPALVFVVAGLFLIRDATRWEALLAWAAIAFVAAYGAYWFDGFFAGPRFLFTAVPAFIYFAARLPAEGARSPRPIVRHAARLVIPVCLAVAWLGPVGVSSARARLASYSDQRSKLKTDVGAQLRRANVHHALVFVNEGWRGRLLARLRVIGATQFRADRLASTLDACALQTALDGEDTLMVQHDSERLRRVETRARAAGSARLERNMPADQSIALVPGSRPTPTCLAEFGADTIGTMPYAFFLARQQVTSDRTIGGDVVFARNFGPRNEQLRQRFGDRTWYVYRAPLTLTDTAQNFLTYQRLSR